MPALRRAESAGGIGGKAVGDAGPAITFGIREAALTRPDGSEIAARLVAGLTDAVARVLGEQARSGTTVELVATPEGRTGGSTGRVPAQRGRAA